MQTPWPYFPVFLKLTAQRVLVVGGGEIALRKIRLLSRAGARIEVVAHALLPEIASLGVIQIAKEFDPEQLRGCALAIAATNDPALNARVAAAAQDRAVPINVVDDGGASTFITPSIVERAPLLVAISTGGAAPLLARRLREQFEALIPSAFGALATFLGRMRDNLKTFPVEKRRRVLEDFLDGTGAQLVLRGDEVGAEIALSRLTQGTATASELEGEVYLVGAGPGDPDLLTLRALQLMQKADAVLYDRLVAPAILDRVRRDAERVFVGKGPKQHEMPQEEINTLLVKLARQGKRVLRLKGGDPFIFGRGGEEIETLAAQNISFQVVPGITAANGCAAYAGIPLTHRDCAQSVTFVTGHARQDGRLELDWPSLAKRGQTVVFYMGRNSLPNLCENLVQHGLPSDWPAALVEQGTSPEQRVICATLGDLPSSVERAGISGASLVIVGEVVRLRERLQWYKPSGRNQG